MKSTTVIFASLLASTAMAKPLGNHAKHHHTRAYATVWVTDTDVVTETIDVTTTIWIPSDYVPPTLSATTSSSTSDSAAQFFQPVTYSVYVEPIPATTASSSTSTSTSVSVTPAAVEPTTSSVYVAPVPVESSSSSTAAAAPAAEAYTPPAVTTTTSSAAPAVSTTASSSGLCDESSPCTGDITYYTAGLGACGVTSDGSTQSVVALSYLLMGSDSNDNPYCGKTITITCTATGESTTAIVVDKCMGCDEFSIDLSTFAFSNLDPNYLTVGRELASWYFND